MRSFGIRMNDRRIFLLLAVAVLVYVALRAVHVPITHDEACTYFVYVDTGSFLPFHSHWDAGNHFLSTALAWVSFSLFGMAPWALRLFSVLGYVLYAWYVHAAGAMIKDRLVRWCTWSALLMLPWVIEFFALFRGYGLAMAFWMMGLVHLLRYINERRTRDLVCLLLAMTLASFASLSMLVLNGGIMIALVPLMWTAPKRTSLVGQLLAWLLIGALPLWYAARIGMEMSARGLLYYGSEEGIYDGTLASLQEVLFGSGAWLLPVLVGLVATGMVIAVLRIRQQGMAALKDPLVITAALLLFESIGRKAMAVLMHTLYPIDRTCMQYVPLAVLLIAFAVDRSSAWMPRARHAALILLVLPVRTLFTADLDHTVQWRSEAVSMNVLLEAQARQRAASRPLSIAGYSQVPGVWDYARALHHLDLPSMSSLGFPQPLCDLLLIDTTYFNTPEGFRTIAVANAGRQVLKERIVPLDLRPMLDTTFQRALDSSEFRPFWEPDLGGLRNKDLFLEIELNVSFPLFPITGNIIIDGNDDQGGHAFYDQVDLRTTITGRGHGTLHIMRRIPRMDEHITRLACYLYDPDKAPLALDRARLKVFEVKAGGS